MTGQRKMAARTPTPEQQRAANPSKSVWVAANAGSGKTQVLTDRLLRLLLEGVEPQSILCLTYTKAAATEMMTRLFATLSRWLHLSDDDLGSVLAGLGADGRSRDVRKVARRLFARALETPGGLKIQTIHAFAERLLQLFPVEAGLAPGFRVAEDEQSERLRHDAILACLADEALSEDWARITTAGLRDFKGLDELAKVLLSKGRPTLQTMLEGGEAKVEAELCRALGMVTRHPLADIVEEITDIDTAKYRGWADKLVRSPLLGEKDDDHHDFLKIADADGAKRLAAIKNYFLTADGNFGKKFIRIPLAKNAGIAAEFADEVERLRKLFASYWSHETLVATMAALRVMAHVRQLIEAAKRARGLYDFDDLIARAAKLLSSVEQAQWVLYKLDKGLNHILVDEAQDTSPAQWQIIMALAQEFFAGQGQHDGGPRSLFVVGDRKQSIFSFQGADVRSFEEARATLRRWAGANFDEVGLTVSYRSLAHVLRSVDLVFEKGGEARKGFAGEEERPHQHHRGDSPGVVEFWPLFSREEGDEDNHWKVPADVASVDHPRRKLARCLAATIKSWIGRRRLHGADRPVSPGDVLILVQRRNLLFSSLIAELRRLDIPVAGADRLKLAGHIITHDLLALLDVLRLPGDDLSLAALLKSPLMPEPLDDEALFPLAYDRGDASLRQRLADDPKQRANVESLKSYELAARTAGPFSFLSGIIHARRQAILQRLGSEAEDAMRAVLDQALTYERNEGCSLAGFAISLKESGLELKREMEKPQDEVRIMTVHGSKGLEAPIVILADAADQDIEKNPSRVVFVAEGGDAPGLPVLDLEQVGEIPPIKSGREERKQAGFAESMRLFYVAMTRARDELYVCGAFNKKSPSQASWYKLMEKAIATDAAGFRSVVLPDGRTARRLGPDDERVMAERLTAVGQPDIPQWLLAVHEPEPAPQTHLAQDDATLDLAAARRGIAIHGLLEAMPGWPPAQRWLKAIAKASRHGLEEDLVIRLLRLMDDSETSLFFGPESQAEVTIAGRADDGAVQTGRLDRLAFHEGTIYILDYKSARKPEGAIPPNHPYRRQLATYAELLSRAYPGQNVKAALLWTQSGELEWVSVG